MAFKIALLLLSALHCIVTDAAVKPIHDLRTKSAPLLSKRQNFDSVNVNPSTLYPAYNLSVPIDHFFNESQYEPHSTGNFQLRYWFDATYYKKGGPVIMLEGGEDSGADRLVYLQKGLLAEMAQATNGVGVVLEHRFYGTSMPTSDLSTQSLRFLTTQQALADTAYFAQNVVFPGVSDNLKAPNVPWIAYGGSYAGAFVAFLRTRYPDVFFGKPGYDGMMRYIEANFRPGAIASSAVTEAIYDFWDYYTPIKTYGPAECIQTTQLLTNVVDNILINKAAYTSKLKEAFGLQGLTYTTDFANVLSNGIGQWQGRNWDPAITNTAFDQYCGNVSSNETLYSVSSTQTSLVTELLNAAGYGSQSYLVNRMLNYIGWISTNQVTPCISSGESPNQCFTTQNATFYAQNDITQTWRSWPYQYCSQWGFLQTGSGVPAGQLPLISRTIDLNYQGTICKDAFNIVGPANVSAINAYGGYKIGYSRLAFIDGQADPWRGATIHADGAPARYNTIDQPSYVIPGAVHHWDENGLFYNESSSSLPPSSVALMQATEINFVQAWLKQWTGTGGTTTYSRLVVGGTVTAPLNLSQIQINIPLQTNLAYRYRTKTTLMRISGFETWERRLVL